MSSKAQKKKNIQAIVRVRPLNGAEIMDKARSIVSVDSYAKTINVREKTTGMKPYGPFDKVWILSRVLIIFFVLGLRSRSDSGPNLQGCCCAVDSASP